MSEGRHSGGRIRHGVIRPSCSRAQSAQSWWVRRGLETRKPVFGEDHARDDRRRSMDLMSGEADPSEMGAAERNSAASATPSRVTFNRFELNRILNLYGRMVSDGEWRDYAID